MGNSVSLTLYNSIASSSYTGSSDENLLISPTTNQISDIAGKSLAIGQATQPCHTEQKEEGKIKEITAIDFDDLSLEGKTFLEYSKQIGPHITAMDFSVEPFLGGENSLNSDLMIKVLNQYVSVNTLTINFEYDKSFEALPFLTKWVKNQSQLFSMNVTLRFTQEHAKSIGGFLNAAYHLKNLTINCSETYDNATEILGAYIPLRVDSLSIKCNGEGDGLIGLLIGLAKRTESAETTKLEIFLTEEGLHDANADHLFDALVSFIFVTELNLHCVSAGINKSLCSAYFDRIAAMTHLQTLKIYDLPELSYHIGKGLSRLPNLTSLELIYPRVTKFTSEMEEHLGLRELKLLKILGDVRGLSTIFPKLPQLEKFSLGIPTSVEFNHDELDSELNSEAFKNLSTQRPSLKIEVFDSDTLE